VERSKGAIEKAGPRVKLFVGSLSWDTTDQSLREAFERFGEVVEAKVITERDSGRSRGFGFVTFTDDEAGRNAISEMDGAELDGRTIRVDEARERKPRDSR
jgi:cold-inducible RNA-binding protein